MYTRIAALLSLALALTGANALSLGLGHTGSAIPVCSLIAQDAWNFDDLVPNVQIPWYDNMGGQGPQGVMFCDDFLNDPECPDHLDTGGPNGNGSVHIFSDTGGSWIAKGLRANDKTWMDYDTANKVSVTFHFKARRTSPLSYGEFSSPVVQKAEEFFSGADHSGAHAERICMNVYDINDLGGPDSTLGTDCGATVSGTNNGLGATTGVLSMPVDVWQHIALVFNGETPPDSGADNGTYKVYLNGDLINTETGIDGVIANSSNRWYVGVGASASGFTDFEIDNLQIFKLALSASQVADLDCDVPDV